MKEKKPHRLSIILTLLLCLPLCAGILAKKTTAGSVTMNAALYQAVPGYEAFEETIAECWKEIHPETELNFVVWDCYKAEDPADIDVFVFDVIRLDEFAEKGYLLPLSEDDIQEYDDLLPYAAEGCRVDRTICAVPQLLCTDLLYTRRQDTALKNIQSIGGLYDVIGDDGLLMDKDSALDRVGLYLHAQVDEKQQFTDEFAPIGKGKLSPETIEAFRKIRNMHLTDREDVRDNNDPYYYARRFAEGFGRAYIGYSEVMSVMDEKAVETDFRLFSMTDDETVPAFFADAAAVNAKISDEKRELALDLLNLLTSKETLVRAMTAGGNPRYLLAARYSVYDALSADWPVYEKLKNIVSVPEASVIRIFPDGYEYLETSEKNVDLLPSITK